MGGYRKGNLHTNAVSSKEQGRAFARRLRLVVFATLVKGLGVEKKSKREVIGDLSEHNSNTLGDKFHEVRNFSLPHLLP